MRTFVLFLAVLSAMLQPLAQASYIQSSGGGSGGVSSVGLSLPSSTFTVTGSPVTTAGTLTGTFKTQTANKVFAGPTTGAAAVPAFRLLVGADLPLPGAASLGGVFSKAAVTHQFLTAIVAADGSVTSAQPAFTDISGAATGAQLPTFTGDVTNVAAAMTVAKIQTTTVSGTTGSGNVVFSASPTLTGTANVANVAASGDVTKGNCYVSPKESDLGNSGASLAIDLGTATTFTITLNSATPTLTFSNPVAGCAYAIILTQGSGGSKVPTWAGTTNIWGNSGTKTLSTGAGAVDKVTCVYNAAITSLMCDLGKDYL
jgi:hypothetical protein